MKAMEINREQFEQMVNGEDWGRHMKKLQKNIMAEAF